MPATQLDIALLLRPKGRKLRRPRLQRYPLTIERRFAAELRDLAAEAIDRVNAAIVPQLGRWAQLAGVRQDQIGDWTDELEAEFTIIRREFERRDGEFRQIAETVSRETSTFNRVEVGRQISGVVGSNVMPLSNDDDVIKGFINSNIQAIKSVPSDYFGKVERIISEGFRSGRRASALAGDISEAGKVSKRRGAFIARDQISTLNSQLTQRRHRSLGIDEYIWRTSLDEAVRPSHAQLEGTRHSWDDPPTVGSRQVHPGEDYICRCTPEPIIEGIEPEATSPADVPAPLPSLGRRRARRPAGARRRRQSTGAATAAVEDPRREGLQVVRDIPTSAEPVVARMPRTGFERRLDRRQSLRLAVARVLDQSPATRAVATTNQRLDRLLWNWVHGARRKTSVELKQAAIREFKLRGVAFNPRKFTIAETDVRQSAKDLRTLYNQTQRYLAEQGKRQITVYRGIKQAEDQRGAVESWTTSRAVAKKFAGSGGRVLTETVPVERILAIRGGPQWLDGVFGDQQEVMVLF